jgi:hypothetical protein
MIQKLRLKDYPRSQRKVVPGEQLAEQGHALALW